MVTPETEAQPAKKAPERFRRPQGAYWPIAAALLGALFFAAPAISFRVRLLFAAAGLGILSAAFRFLGVLFAARARGHAEAVRPRGTHLALALPGLCGFATILACALLETIAPLDRDDRTAAAILVLGLLPLLGLASIVGLVASLDGRGPFRLLAIVANAAFPVVASLLVLAVLN